MEESEKVRRTPRRTLADSGTTAESLGIPAGTPIFRGEARPIPPHINQAQHAVDFLLNPPPDAGFGGEEGTKQLLRKYTEGVVLPHLRTHMGKSWSTEHSTAQQFADTPEHSTPRTSVVWHSRIPTNPEQFIMDKDTDWDHWDTAKSRLKNSRYGLENEVIMYSDTPLEIHRADVTFQNPKRTESIDIDPPITRTIKDKRYPRY